MKKTSIVLLLVITAASLCRAQTKPKNFKKLVYHSSYCFGNCPKIDMQIDSKRNIYVYRDFAEATGNINGSGTSGYFKGVLDVKTYNKLLNMLVKSKYNQLKFPDVTCCDGVVTTIIVYAAGKRTYLKSMTPPRQATQLIELLYNIGLETQLQPTDKRMDLEE